MDFNVAMFIGLGALLGLAIVAGVWIWARPKVLRYLGGRDEEGVEIGVL